MPAFDRKPPSPTERLERALTIIEQLLHDPALSISKIAANAAMSRSEIYRLFKSRGGVECYVTELRLGRLREALLDGKDKRPFYLVARAHGFKNAGHASRSFKKLYGMQPSHYRHSSGQFLDDVIPHPSKNPTSSHVAK